MNKGQLLTRREFFAARLRKQRKQRRWSQDELGEKVGVPSTTISHFESKRRLPSSNNLLALAEALDVSMDYLVGRTDNPLAHHDVDAYLQEGAMSPEDQALLLAVAKRLKKEGAEEGPPDTEGD